jgi:hypothetical protein
VTQSGQYWFAFALMAILPIIAGGAMLFSTRSKKIEKIGVS